jgi:hypothetical protein
MPTETVIKAAGIAVMVAVAVYLISVERIRRAIA